MNEEFTDLEGEPRQLFFPKMEILHDGDIIYKNGIFHIYKTEDMKRHQESHDRQLTSGAGSNNPITNSKPGTP